MADRVNRSSELMEWKARPSPLIMHNNFPRESCLISRPLQTYDPGTTASTEKNKKHRNSIASPQNSCAQRFQFTITKMSDTLSLTTATVATRKQSDRRNDLHQFAHAANLDAKPDDDVVNVQAYPQAILTERQRNIVNCDATALVELIRKGLYTSTEILTAFVTVAIRANEVTNCLTESCLKDAFERATKLDLHYEKTGELVGPLHGVPVSIKDHIKVKGLDTSAGYTGKSAVWYWTAIYHALISLGIQDGVQR